MGCSRICNSTITGFVSSPTAASVLTIHIASFTLPSLVPRQLKQPQELPKWQQQLLVPRQVHQQWMGSYGTTRLGRACYRMALLCRRWALGVVRREGGETYMAVRKEVDREGVPFGSCENGPLLARRRATRLCHPAFCVWTSLPRRYLKHQPHGRYVHCCPRARLTRKKVQPP